MLKVFFLRIETQGTFFYRGVWLTATEAEAWAREYQRVVKVPVAATLEVMHVMADMVARPELRLHEAILRVLAISQDWLTVRQIADAASPWHEIVLGTGAVGASLYRLAESGKVLREYDPETKPVGTRQRYKIAP